MAYAFAFEPILANWPMLAKGAALTLLLTTVGAVLGLALGVCGAACRVWRIHILAPAFGVYVECVRNTPFLVQLYFIYFGLPALGVRLGGVEASLLAMVVNLGAYSTEIIRAGIQSIPAGLVEAGHALAMSPWQIMRHVILAPALANVWPALCSQIVIVMLGSSVCSQIAAEELTFAANLIQTRTFRAFEVYAVSTAVYLALAVVVRQALMAFGRRTLSRGRP